MRFLAALVCAGFLACGVDNGQRPPPNFLPSNGVVGTPGLPPPAPPTTDGGAADAGITDGGSLDSGTPPGPGPTFDAGPPPATGVTCPDGTICPATSLC